MTFWESNSGGAPGASGPAVAAAYPGLVWSAATDGAGIGSGRFPVAVSDPPPALLTDWRFPQVPSAEPSLSDYQTAMLVAAAQWQAAQIDAGFAYGGRTYPLDTDSKVSWHVVLTLTASLTFPVSVVTNDGMTTVGMDQSTALAAAAAALTAGFGIDQTYAGYVAAIGAATTTEQLDSITFAWPSGGGTANTIELTS